MMNGKKVSKYNFLDRLKPFRSSRSGVFCKKDGFRNFAKFIGKYLCLRPATLVKKRLWHWRFPLNFAKFLKTPFFIEHSGGCFLPFQVLVSRVISRISACPESITTFATLVKLTTFVPPSNSNPALSPEDADLKLYQTVIINAGRFPENFPEIYRQCWKHVEWLILNNLIIFPNNTHFIEKPITSCIFLISLWQITVILVWK